METKEEEQESTQLYEDPKLPLYSIAEKIQALDREVRNEIILFFCISLQ